ncbi:uncharacterized protein C1orf127 homolog [Betta splendens]|uniref:Uncharacterized protein C1orf127 homolog n=1 Tax=Betta splendens TaxID=158456 RepID=A0A6P7MYG6_BETSP|nr:uncharacterized protein C1orf127 homolog [Betta splendens]
MIEGLVIWLSEALQIQVRPASLDHLNLQLSACGFSLHKDPDDNFAFRVSYTGCLVQQQHSFHVLKMNLVKRTSRFGGRAHSLLMTCPVVSVLPNMEHIQCDPEYIQVIRQVPFDNWDNELHWSLSSRERLVVALEDASLIQMSVDVNGSHIAVQGRRSEVLSPVEGMGNREFLALKLVSGQYAYSMEVTCPTVTSSTAAQTVLHIFKRRMGLTKRGPSVGGVWVKQTRRFTVRDAGGFVALLVPTERILQTRACAEREQLVQPFYRVDVVLTFRETNHKMHWTMENTLPCTARPAGSHIASSPGPSLDHEEPGPPRPLLLAHGQKADVCISTLRTCQRVKSEQADVEKKAASAAAYDAFYTRSHNKAFDFPQRLQASDGSRTFEVF